jgi:DnaJ-class molecular chaperone
MHSKEWLRGKMAKKTKKQFDPEKYGMTICPHCNGSGSLQDSPDSMNVCTKCGGFGLVRKEERED